MSVDLIDFLHRHVFVRQSFQPFSLFSNITILAWRHPWNVPTEGWKTGVLGGGCYLTYDRSKLKEAAAVLFHYSGLDQETMPWKHYR